MYRQANGEVSGAEAVIDKDRTSAILAADLQCDWLVIITNVPQVCTGFGTPNGQLILWFPPFDRFPGPPGAYPHTDATSGNFCKLATDIGTAGAVAVDARGRLYLASSSRFAIYRRNDKRPGVGVPCAVACDFLRRHDHKRRRKRIGSRRIASTRP